MGFFRWLFTAIIEGLVIGVAAGVAIWYIITNYLE